MAVLKGEVDRLITLSGPVGVFLLFKELSLLLLHNRGDVEFLPLGSSSCISSASKIGASPTALPESCSPAELGSEIRLVDRFDDADVVGAASLLKSASGVVERLKKDNTSRSPVASSKLCVGILRLQVGVFGCDCDFESFFCRRNSGRSTSSVLEEEEYRVSITFLGP